jgi:hypothetical protein
MDGEPEPSHEVTRVPNDADLVSLARELNRLGVAYVVVGGFATEVPATAHSRPRRRRRLTAS